MCMTLFLYVDYLTLLFMNALLVFRLVLKIVTWQTIMHIIMPAYLMQA